MIEDYEKRKRDRYGRMRAILDYGIGVAVVIAGLFMFFRHLFDLDFNTLYEPNYTDKLIGILFIIYGLWRIYRGYKKNYFK